MSKDDFYYNAFDTQFLEAKTRRTTLLSKHKSGKQSVMCTKLFLHYKKMKLFHQFNYKEEYSKKFMELLY